MTKQEVKRAIACSFQRGVDGPQVDLFLIFSTTADFSAPTIAVGGPDLNMDGAPHKCLSGYSTQRYPFVRRGHRAKRSAFAFSCNAEWSEKKQLLLNGKESIITLLLLLFLLLLLLDGKASRMTCRGVNSITKKHLGRI